MAFKEMCFCCLFFFLVRVYFSVGIFGVFFFSYNALRCPPKQLPVDKIIGQIKINGRRCYIFKKKRIEKKINEFLPKKRKKFFLFTAKIKLWTLSITFFRFASLSVVFVCLNFLVFILF